MLFSPDHLSETEFEEFCFDLLHELGFVNISWRKGTGHDSSPADQGRDLECERIVRDEVDGSSETEKWFVECKHYKKGVPPDKLSGPLAWASAETPDRLLIIASNFLSNPTKESLKRYVENNRPRFRIKTWERSDLERLTIGNDRLEKNTGLEDLT